MNEYELNDEVARHMRPSAWTNANHAQFLPADSFHDLFTRATLRECLPQATEEFIDRVFTTALKVFAILVHVNVRLDVKQNLDLYQKLSACVDAGLEDRELPVSPPCKLCACQGGKHVGRAVAPNCGHGPGVEILRQWGFAAWHGFHQHQWAYLAPVFSDAEFEFEHKLHPDTILPFVELTAESTEGFFGEVRRAKLHGAHHSGFNWLPNIDKDIAIKEFKENPQRSMTAEGAWQAEKENLAMISDQAHAHLIARIASIAMGDKYFILYDWADGGDLRRFWREMPNPQLDKGMISETIKQLQGLASAIERLHHGLLSADTSREFAVPQSSNYPATAVQPQIPIVKVSGDNNDQTEVLHNGAGASFTAGGLRHGDLKAENILIFLVPDRRLGVLKIADLGLAKKHLQGTAHRHTHTNTKFATLIYEAPEAMRPSVRSRLYDIWSFGCVMLEFVIWLWYGYNGIVKFLELESGAGRGTPFYTRAGTSATVSNGVTHIIEMMKREMKEAKRRTNWHGFTSLVQLLELIQDKVLVIHLPGLPEHSLDKCRINAEKLVHELTRISHNADVSTDDIFIKHDTHESFIASMKNLSLTPSANEGLTVPGFAMGGPVGSVSRQMEIYQHESLNENDWKYTVDNFFAIQYIRNVSRIQMTMPIESSAYLCSECLQIRECAYLEAAGRMRKLSVERSCDLCKLFRQAVVQQSQRQHEEQVKICRLGSRILIESNGTTLGSLSLCRLFDPSRSSLPDVPPHITSTYCDPEQHGCLQVETQVSQPQLFKINSAARSELLRLWLSDCDQNHTDCRRAVKIRISSPDLLPKRVLQIGKHPDSTILLVNTASINGHHDQELRYAALSYQWGHKDTHKHFQTTRENLEKREAGMQLTELPQLYKDAIDVTRGIGLEYLWIDALCTIQGKGGDANVEIQRMETVYSSAYCVIAASRANGVSDGFLHERDPSLVVKFPGSSLFVRKDIDNFKQDVIDGALNQRGWILQERALARRTIYFTSTQIYWECGKGIQCETMTKMTNKGAAVYGDPNFPQVAQRDTKGGKIEIFQQFYERYSRLAFSHAHDRPIAIAGLEARLCRAFDSPGGFGVFDKYKGRSILWRRAPTTAVLSRIRFPHGQKYVPSWSWMAYTGAITYLKPPPGDVDWCYDDFRWLIATKGNGLTRNEAINRGWKKDDLHVTARQFNPDSINPRANPSIIWDQGEVPIESLACVIIGMARSQELSGNPDCYVLVIRKSENAGEYERAGVGIIQYQDIALDEQIEIILR